MFVRGGSGMLSGRWGTLVTLGALRPKHGVAVRCCRGDGGILVSVGALRPKLGVAVGCCRGNKEKLGRRQHLVLYDPAPGVAVKKVLPGAFVARVCIAQASRRVSRSKIYDWVVLKGSTHAGADVQPAFVCEPRRVLQGRWRISLR